MRKIPKELKKDFGKFIHSMIKDLSIETEENVSVIISFLANEYDVSTKDIRECLKSVKSIFTSNNNVIYYDSISKKFIKRTTLLARIGNVFTKIGNDMKKIDENFDPSEIFKVVETIYS